MSLDVLNINQLTSQRFQGSLFMEINYFQRCLHTQMSASSGRFQIQYITYKLGVGVLPFLKNRQAVRDNSKDMVVDITA